jgi:hypothetical protein
MTGDESLALLFYFCHKTVYLAGANFAVAGLLTAPRKLFTDAYLASANKANPDRLT